MQLYFFYIFNEDGGGILNTGERERRAVPL